MTTGAKIGIAVLGFFVIAIPVTIILINKKGNSTTPLPTASAPPVPGAPCNPYSQDEYDRAVKNCRSKCLPQSLIPIVGAGAYIKCMNACKQGIPFVTVC